MPSVDAVVAWIDADADAQGRRPIRLYDRGELRSARLDPIIADSDTTQIDLAVSPTGRGFAVSSTKGGTVWVDLVSGQRGRIGLGPWGELGSALGFARSGMAIVRTLAAGPAAGDVLLPIGGATPTPLMLTPPPATSTDGSAWVVRPASDAPVVFVAERVGADGVVGGTIAAYAFPGPHHLGDVHDLVELGRSTMHVRPGVDDPGDDAHAHALTPWCDGGLCVTPDGDAALGTAFDACTLLRWRWGRTGSDGASRPPLEVPLPAECDVIDEPRLLAALSDDLVVLQTGERHLLADLSARGWVELPRLGVGSTDAWMVPADRGRAMVFINAGAQVVRMDHHGISLVNGERNDCALHGPPVVSPDGNWVLMTCIGDPSGVITEFPTNELAAVVRVSALGLERYDGLPMAPLAIDDAGNALLYTFDPDDDDAKPRGMFVLEGDGRLTRIDDLEPTPAQLGVSGMLEVYFARSADWPGGGGPGG